MEKSGCGIHVDAINQAPGIFASLLWAAGKQGAVVPGASVPWMNFIRHC